MALGLLFLRAWWMKFEGLGLQHLKAFKSFGFKSQGSLWHVWIEKVSRFGGVVMISVAA